LVVLFGFIFLSTRGCIRFFPATLRIVS